MTNQKRDRAGSPDALPALALFSLVHLRGVPYGFWYNSNGNVIFGLVGIPPAMEVQCNWIGCCLSPNVSTILVLHGMVTTMLVQFLRLVDVPTLLEVKKNYLLGLEPKCKYNF